MTGSRPEALIPASSHSRGLLLAGAVAIVLMTLTCYAQSLGGAFIWDDDWWVTDNDTLRSWGGLWRIWTDPTSNQQYYPLTSTSFWLEFRLWSLDPFGYRLTNIGLHAANALLVWSVLRKLAVPGAWAAAAIFAVHPVHVESVAWITERKNVLSGLFFLLALRSYLNYTDRGRAVDYRIALACFLSALMSKTATCTLPIVILLLVMWKRRRLTRLDLRNLLPFVVIGACFGALTAWLEVHHIGAKGHEWDLSGFERVLVAGRALWFYGSKLVWPADLVFIYPRWEIDASVSWQYLYPLGAAGVSAVLWLVRRRIGLGPLTAGLCFVVTLAPSLGFFRVFFMRYSFVQDHFQYLASIALIAVGTSFAAQGIARLRIARIGVTMVLLLAVLVPLGRNTWSRASVFRDSESLWRDSLAGNPDAWLPHNNLGIILAGKEDYQNAVDHYQRAMRIRPDYPETYFNVGHAYAAQGRLDDAIEMLQSGLRINSGFAEEHYHLGRYLSTRGRLEECIKHLQSALSLQPFFREAHLALGDTLLAAERYEEALEHYRTAADRRSPFASDYNNLGNLLARQNKADQAESRYRQAIVLQPDYAEAHFNLGVVLHARGDLRGAAGAFEAALRGNADLAKAAFNLGVVLQSAGDSEGAIRAFRLAVAADSDPTDALFNLASVLSQLGLVSEAIEHYRRALETRPDFASAHHNLAVALFHEGDYPGAWEHARAAERLGEPPSQRFFDALGKRAPEPVTATRPDS